MQSQHTNTKPYGCIYVITNLVNGKYYIGQTTDSLKARWSQHCSDAKCRDGHQFLHKAFRKYGIDNFVIEEVATADSYEALNALEQAWVLSTGSYNPRIGYNRTYGGGGGHTIEVRKKISELGKGRKLSEEHKAHIAAAQRGKKRQPHSHERRRQISQSLTGKVRSIESRLKQSASAKGKHVGKPKSPEHKAKIAATLRGRKLPPQVVAKVVAARRGYKHSPEARANMSAAQRALGKKLSDHTKALLSAAHKGKRQSPESIEKARLKRIGRKQTPEHQAAIAQGKRKARERRIAERGQGSFQWD